MAEIALSIDRVAAAGPEADDFLAEVKHLLDGGGLDEAVALIEARLANDPADEAALIGLGFAAFGSDRLVASLEAFRSALELAPGSALAADCLALLYAIAGEVAEATYYAKLALANGFDEMVARRRPAAWPDLARVFRAMSERPLLARGLKLTALGQADAGFGLIEAQAAFSPDDGQTQRAYADALLAQGQSRKAAEILSRFAANGTADTYDLSRLAQALAFSGETATGGILAEAADITGDDPGAGAEVVCAAGLAAALAGEDAAAAIAVRVTKLLPPRPALVAAAPLPERPRIGILATALSDPADIETIAALAHGLRATKLAETVVFGAGSLDQPHNRLLQSRVGRHVDAASFDGETLAHTVMGEAIDLLIDAGGLFAPVHALAMSLHPARRVLSWLGTTTALPWSDGLLPPSCQLGRIETVARPQRPAGPPLIGCDLLPGLLHDDMLDLLAGLMAAVPDARLLLRDRDFSHPDNVSHLIARCQPRGFAERIELVAGDAISFIASLDLYVPPTHALTTQDVVSALSIGTPCVALTGAAAGALLTLGLNDLVAADAPAFVALGAHLATDEAAGPALARRAASLPAFDPATFATVFMKALTS